MENPTHSECTNWERFFAWAKVGSKFQSLYFRINNSGFDLTGRTGFVSKVLENKVLVSTQSHGRIVVTKGNFISVKLPEISMERITCNEWTHFKQVVQPGDFIASGFIADSDSTNGALEIISAVVQEILPNEVIVSQQDQSWVVHEENFKVLHIERLVPDT